LGNAPANILFDAITAERIDSNKPAQKYSDYNIAIAKDSIPQGVEVLELL